MNRRAFWNSRYSRANPRSRCALATLLGAALIALVVSPCRALAGKVDFVGQIRPILSQNCFRCHGPDDKHRAADLRLDVKDLTQAKDDSKIVVPGKSADSLLFQRIVSSDPDERMPPPDSGNQLSSQQIELLKRWIDEGAESRGHWAYEQPVKPNVAERINPIDCLVERQLQSAGLALSAEADRRTLVRRLYFDLLGLPPEPDVVDAFVHDSSSDAYEKLVERLLSSPHFGERMAIGWLDVVRFADTVGYHSDGPRNVWPYRDWVIRAFNENMPFDRFTIEQLAGDLLPEGTTEQKVAACFNRLLRTTEEGGAQIKDYEARMLADRVRAVGTIWLGQTLGCCECHDHKFDPATARDFYSLGAFFADIDEPIIKELEPGIAVPTAAQAAELARLEQHAAALAKEYDAPPPRLVAAQKAWEETLRAELADAEAWHLLKPTEAVSEHGTKLSIADRGTVLVDAKSAADTDVYVLTIPLPSAIITGLRIDVLPHAGLPQQGPGLGQNGRFVLSEVTAATADGRQIDFAHADATYEESEFPAYYAIDANLSDGRGWAAGVPGAVQSVSFEFAQPLSAGEGSTLTLRLHQLSKGHNLIGHFRVMAATQATPVRAPRAVAPSNEIEDMIRLQPEARTAEQQARVTQAFKSQVPELVDLHNRATAAKLAATNFASSLPRCLTTVATQKPRTVRILPRGNWMDESGPVVEPALPHYLSQSIPTGGRLTRLDLAQWIVSRENPLTARVFMNRLWKQLFGCGLVTTSDDFGSQGDAPSNPALLDWLSREFVDSGWDIKHMLRLIVGSRTYRQTSAVSAELLARDPDNRFFARQGRFRFDAELVRDNALAISGLLTRTIGGPSVKPYQPAGYWEHLNLPTRIQERDYVADRGANQYRRGLYTWWQRTFLHPSLVAFDAPNRDECAADRPRSCIPQQALVLLNDPTYVESARALAARAIAEGGSDPTARVQWLWRQALSRAAREDELATALTLLEKHRSQLTQDRVAADQLLKVGDRAIPADVDTAELAAWTSVARVVLNLHETNNRN